MHPTFRPGETARDVRTYLHFDLVAGVEADEETRQDQHHRRQEAHDLHRRLQGRHPGAELFQNLDAASVIGTANGHT